MDCLKGPGLFQGEGISRAGVDNSGPSAPGILLCMGIVTRPSNKDNGFNEWLHFLIPAVLMFPVLHRSSTDLSGQNPPYTYTHSICWDTGGDRAFWGCALPLRVSWP